MEKLIIKNFGPIHKAEIDMKPFTVFIGESGSGKSVIMKTLAMCRWIYKRLNFASIVAHIEPINKNKNMIDAYKRIYNKEIREIKIAPMIKESGLDEFFNRDGETEIIYEVENFSFSITNRDNKPIFVVSEEQKYIPKDKIILEKISFISDDRIAVPLFLQGLQTKELLPFHTQETFNKFITAFQYLDKHDDKKIQTIDFQIIRDKKGKWFIEKEGTVVSLHQASSGIKSVAVLESITNYFVKYYNMQDSLNRFLISNQMDNINFLLDMVMNIQKGNISRDYQQIISLFVEEPELNLFPKAQKKLLEYFVSLCFHSGKTTRLTLATHSPYILTSLNCFLEAYQVVQQKPHLENKVIGILPKQFWVDHHHFHAYMVENGAIKSIMDTETGLILAEAIDHVSDEIGEIFDSLLECGDEE